MDGIRKIARAYYERASEDEKSATKAFLKTLDSNGDGKVRLVELKVFGTSWLCDDKLFNQLDLNGDGTLDFHEALALYYMEQNVVVSSCASCRDWLVGRPYFSCLPCLTKVDRATDLCCDCYHGGRFKHHHAPSEFMDHHALLTMAKDCDGARKNNQKKEAIKELGEIATAHYLAGSHEVRNLAHDFFNALDTNGDGFVDRQEFLSFMTQEGYAQMRNHNFFKELDLDGNGTLDFDEVMTLYYIIKSGRPFCCSCREFIPGIFFSCVECYKTKQGSFSLCRVCYGSEKCKHNHNGKTQFLDNYTLLEAQRDSALALAAGLQDHTETMTTGSTSTRSPISHNAIVPASNANMHINNNIGPTYHHHHHHHTYVVNHPNPWPNYSTAILPASKINKWKDAFRAFEIGLSLGSISTTLCSIL